ncbi:hypothetical protein L915_14603, partial [Phytophthora nicotianae]
GNYNFAMEQLKNMMERFKIPFPQLVLADCEMALLNILEKKFPDVSALLCIWHEEKNVQKHARRNALPQVVDEEASTSNKTVKKDSEDHEAFCKAFRS